MTPYPAHDGTPPAVSSPPAKLRRAGMPHRQGKGSGDNIRYRMPQPFDRSNTRAHRKNRRRLKGRWIGQASAQAPAPEQGPEPKPPPVFDPGKQPVDTPDSWGK